MGPTADATALRALVDRLPERSALQELSRRWDGGEPVAAAIAAAVADAADAAAARGWDPVELQRLVGRRQGECGRLLEAALRRGGDGVERCRSRLGARTTAALAHAGVLLSMLRSVGAPPGAGRAAPPPGPAAVGDVEAGVLAKVRALLAKAESTTFEAEAEALSAKAQELMARHAIDAALLAGASVAASDVRCIRIRLDDPYTDAKATLLHVVAKASGCRAVHYPDLGVCLVYGFAADLEGVELLHTSLLVQATSAMLAAGAGAGAGTRPRSRGFRSAFLHGYAARIGQRLAAATAVAREQASAERGVDLLPVLASRRSAVDEAVRADHPRLARPRRRLADGVGFSAGERAAASADLGAKVRPIPTPAPLGSRG